MIILRAFKINHTERNTKDTLNIFKISFSPLSIFLSCLIFISGLQGLISWFSSECYSIYQPSLLQYEHYLSIYIYPYIEIYRYIYRERIHSLENAYI